MKIKLYAFILASFLLYSLLECEFIYLVFSKIATSVLFFSCAWCLYKWLLRNVFMDYMSTVSPHMKAILITGCDTGFGHETAKHFNKRGFRVFAGCISAESEGAKILRETSKYPEKMHVLKLDVTNNDDIEMSLKIVKETLGGREKLWAVVNNAGIATSGPVEWGTFENQFEKIIQVNFFGVVKVTRKFLPLIRESKGRIVNVTSLSGRLGLTMTSAYSASKRAAISFTDDLRREMRKFGIHVTSIEPAYYGTPIAQSALESLRKAYEESEEEVKSAYKPMYQQIMKSISKQVNLHKNKPSEVVETIEEAVVCSESATLATYLCFPRMGPVVAIICRLPTEIIDNLFAFLYP